MTAPAAPVSSGGPGGWFANRRVSTKIMAALALTALSTAAGGWLGLVALGSANDQADHLYQDNLLAIRELTDTRGLTRLAVAQVPLMALAGDAQDVREHVAERERLTARADQVWARYTARDLDAEQEAAADRYAAAARRYAAVRDQTLIPLASAHRLAEFEAAYEADGAPLAAEVDQALEELITLADARAAATVAEIHESYRDTRTTMAVVMAAGLALSLAVGLWTVALVVRPLRTVARVLTGMADGDLTQRVEVGSRDETGEMATALNRAIDATRSTVSALDSSGSSLAAAADQLTSTNARIATSAEEASTQADVVAAAAEEVTRNVQEVAAGSHQTTASIREIAQNAHQAAQVAAKAVGVASTTNSTISQLGESSSEIGNVIKVITSIAEQTNLLALNATIEAARAGDAGKGFAVVASEVKDLAQETAKATEDIARRVTAIQGDTDSAVVAISEISEIISRINDYQTTIAAAVEEQTATSSEMNRGVTEAAAGSAEIAANIIAVAAASQQTTQTVGDSQRASAELARMSAEMRGIVGRFRV
jgi:methyl-accepting chemotaxis protein